MRRALALSTAAAALALAGCGDDGASPAAERSPQQRAQDGALKFARCMRERGVDVPDPEVADNGMIRIRPGGGERGASGERPVTPGPKEREAQEACRKHLEAGMPERTPAQEAEMRDAFVKYAE